MTETAYWLRLHEGQVIDLASGYVPSDVKAQCLASLDAHEEDRRRAQRPVATRRTKRKKR